MQETPILAVSKTLASILSISAKVVERAEALPDQTLANDLHAVYRDLRAIYNALPERGLKYKSPLPTVRI